LTTENTRFAHDVAYAKLFFNLQNSVEDDLNKTN